MASSKTEKKSKSGAGSTEEPTAIAVGPGETATGVATGDGNGIILPDATPDADGVTRDHRMTEASSDETLITDPHDGGPLTEATDLAEAAAASFAAATPEEKAKLEELGATLQPSDESIPPVLSPSEASSSSEDAAPKAPSLDEREAAEHEEAMRDMAARWREREPPHPLTSVGQAVLARIEALSADDQPVNVPAIVHEMSLKMTGASFTLEQLREQERTAYEASLTTPPEPRIRRYRVWQHGSFERDGKVYSPGTEIELRDDLAAAISCLEEIPEP